MSSEAETEIITLPPRRRRLVSLIVALVLAGAGVAAAVRWWPAGGARQPAATPSAAVQAARLVRQDLTTTDSLSGTLGYGSAHPVTGGRDGIVTWLAKPGTVVRRGQQLYRVDDQPVPLFYGGMPLFRTVSAAGTVGRDVRIVADNLRALGYRIGRQPKAGERVTRTPKAETPKTETPKTETPKTETPKAGEKATAGQKRVTVVVRTGDGVLTRSLITAVKRWQRDSGLPQTGAIAPGDVVVQAGAVRVDSVAVQPGVRADTPLMSVTPTAKVITVLADLSEASGVASGTRVTVSLPGGKSAPGRVAAVGTEVKEQTGDADAPPRLALTVTLDDAEAAARLDSADVEVAVPGEVHKNVLVAPVGALLALSEGGYAVQVEGGGLVAVRTGMFAKGLVEISGTGLTAGTRVVTTS